jgi:hypothetical protein
MTENFQVSEWEILKTIYQDYNQALLKYRLLENLSLRDENRAVA